ncbi:MAG: nucleoside recognition protein [Calditrichaeota bacterium]|nr:nucleoside recognition protein [Calditrichota bacterium]
MLNYIWLFLVAVSIIIGGINGRIQEVTQAAFNMAKVSVDISFALIGIMAFWLGIMKIAQEGGLVRMLARLLKPIMTRLFPDVPPEHPAMGAMILNISANWLGLSNAATPLGLKAMEELQKINPKKDTATNAMVLFLGVNTASITLIPATMIAVRIQMGSKNPWEIIGTTIFASTMATITAIIASKVYEKLPFFRMKAEPELAETTDSHASEPESPNNES